MTKTTKARCTWCLKHRDYNTMLKNSHGNFCDRACSQAKSDDYWEKARKARDKYRVKDH